MNRFSAFPPSQLLLRLMAAAVTVAVVPSLATAQTGPAPRQTAEDKNAPATISAEKMSGRPDREMILEQDVEIIRGPTTVNSDTATYRIVEDEVEASGNIRMRRFGDTYTGDELRLKMEAQEGYVTNPTYHLQRNNAQGGAERIDFEGEDRATVTDGTYSTCEGPDPDWYLKSSTMNLDAGREEGYARKTVVYFKGLPILAAPAMSFPLSKERKSGVLPPTIGTTNRGGLEVTLPYYFNIAPNRDLTLYPKLYARRGLQLGAEARYLGDGYFGQTRAEYLPHDRQTGTDRYAISSTHTQNLAPGLTYAWNINAASDDRYPDDFSRTLTASSQRLLGRDMALTYAGNFWTAAARVSNFQVLQDPAAPIVRPYDRLPQLTLQTGRQDATGFDWNVDTELTHFYHPDLITGERFLVNPRISYPIIRPGYFITPKLSLHGTEYSLRDQPAGAPDRLSRYLPTVSVDSGLVFERDAKFFGNAMTQTLEPRLFYVYTPYRDQSAFPIFDTAEADLSFAQLFSENRFVGNDRVSDANEITAALISRYIEPTGAERMRLAIGQRFYFNEQRVTLGTTRNESRSDLLLSAYGRLTSAFSVEGNLQYSQTLDSVSRANYGVQWQPAPKSVLNLKYRRDRINNLEQIDVSAQWPFANRWYGVSRVNYSLPDNKVAEGLLGLEYKADCWVFRIVGQRTPTAASNATSSLFFQLELNGLTRLGSNPLTALRENIPGYQLVNQPGNP
ncbi:LPS-assembly protein LptD [Noviherbaspirillum sp. Root189]|uniref:LPS-assembly protein LptD n=1 Tax=Noviherbaspirillum sp. Root189 TaxID=1736487 RepID=UPI00070B05F6|nr:LPS-assembly protein LptD [Noviherbaspirillum sp. Root189]KRB88507.1 OstA organic solvent tolerance protein [Noviherbaspirillum sp. Root189]